MSAIDEAVRAKLSTPSARAGALELWGTLWAAYEAGGPVAAEAALRKLLQKPAEGEGQP